MTRETKIGLLVGLMFIIVIGVLLSDHLTSATQPEIAKVSGAGESAYTTLLTPAAGSRHLTTDITPSPIAPVAPVLAPAENVTIPQPGVADVTVGARPGPVTSLDVTASALRGATPFDSNNEASTLTLSGDRPRVGASAVVTPVAPGESAVLPPSEGVAPIAKPVAREYKAAAGDTLSKMAYRLYGKNTKETRDLIVNANPSLRAAPDRIVVGRAYVIPALPETAPTAAATSTTRPASLVATPAVSTPRIYTVKANDNLWRIATQQCGDARAVDAIVKLNSDQLKSKTQQLKIGMKLRLPEKSN